MALLKFRKVTRAEYDDIVTKDTNTRYTVLELDGSIAEYIGSTRVSYSTTEVDDKMITDLDAHNVRFNGSGTNYLANKNDVESAVKELDERIDVSAQEIIDARQGEATLGANITKVKSQLATTEEQINSLEDYSNAKLVNIGVPADIKPIISFIDDDGAKEVYSRLLPIMQSKNVGFGAAIITSLIGAHSNYMTLTQLQDAHSKGLETLSHTHDVTTDLTDGYTETQIHQQMATSKEWLKNNGFEYEGFVYPQSAYNLSIKRIMRQHYNYAFGNMGINDKGYLEHNTINRIAFGAFTDGNPTINGNSEKNTLDYYKACVDYAITTKSWLIFMLHVSQQPVGYDAMLGELIDYIKSLNVEILKPSQAFKIKANKFNVGDAEENHIFLGESNFDMNVGDYQILKFPIDAINSTDKPSSFANGKLSYCEIVNNVTGYPENRPGVLIVDNVVFSSSKSRQIFRVYKGGATNGLATYERYMINNDAYSEWKKVGDDLSLYLEKITTHVDLPVLYGVNLSGVQAQYKMRAAAIPDSVPIRRTYGFLTNVANTTSNRPNTNLIVGDMFFDTTLGKPVWWNGTNWVDSTGDTV